MFNSAVEFLEGGNWIFAKTMPQNPHHYILRKNCDDNAFDSVVDFIRKNGYKESFKGRNYTMFNANGYKYWTMGAPISETILVNRSKDVVYFTPYNSISTIYDGLFSDENYISQNKELIDLLGIEPSDNVLDIGCGTGFLLDYLKIDNNNYLGTDISKAMLNEFHVKHGNHKTILSSVDDLYTKTKFDKVVALFGVGSYLTENELHKAVNLTKDDGYFFMMAYKDDYFPVTYTKGDIFCNHYAHEKNGFNIIEFYNYVIYTNKRISL